MMLASRFAAVVAVSLFATSAVIAQCPDGTPPPCDARRPTPLSAIPKRVNPPLNDKTWIVLPFNNVTRAPDSDWLSDASVNLLTMDLSRWEDVHVIDDRRVTDFMREVPKSAKLSLNDGMAVAKRAGAGKLVIGDVLKVGSKTTVTATVFNVRDGKQIRSGRQETTIADSIMPMFGKLASELLAVPANVADAGSVGTSRVDAYQEYVAGMQAMKTFDATAAKRHFENALTLDTSFALAHYQWAMAASSDEKAVLARASQLKVSDMNALLKLTEDTARDRHAAAAARLSSGLPPRERKLIAGLQAVANHDFQTACAAYGSLVAADSSDVEALYGYGLCLLSDDMVVAVNGDTTNLRFRTSWNTAIKAFRRALVVDPTFHLAFDQALRYLSVSARMGCRHADVIVSCFDTTAQARYLSAMTRRGDSLVHVPVAMGPDARAIDQFMQMALGVPRRENVEAARAMAEEWVAAGPNEGRAHRYLGQLLLRLGRPAEAELHLRQAALDPSLRGDVEMLRLRLDVAVKLGRGEQAIALMDSIRAAIPGQFGLASFVGLAPMTGRLRESDSIYTALLKPQNPPWYAAGLLMQIPRIAIGMATDTVFAMENALYAGRKSGAQCDPGCLQLMGPSYILGLYLRHDFPKFIGGVDTVTRMAPALALQQKDTASLRRAADKLNAISMTLARSGTAEDGTSLAAAQAYLLLHDAAAKDSVVALAVVRRMMDTTLLTTPLENVIGLGSVEAGLLWPRTLLLRADLEASVAGGDRTLAGKLYGDFLSLWSRADPEFESVLVRVRAAKAKLAKEP